MPIMKLGRRAIAQIPEVTKPTTYFDSDLKGFGLKVLPSGAKSWIVEYRPGAGGRGVAKRRMTIGSPESLSPEQARDLASKTIAKVKLGADPAGDRTSARQSESVDDILDLYLDHHVRPKRKASTVEVYVGFAKHIRAAIGKKSAMTVTRADVARLHRTIGKKHAVTANRVIGLLGSAISYAVKHKTLPKETENPAAGIEPFPESPRERYLTTKELARLGETLRLAETDGIPWEPDPAKNTKHAPRPENRRTKIDPHAAAALRLLILTGCRLREILHLRWSDLDAERGLLFLPDSKTGKKTIVLAAPALAILEGLPRLGLHVIASETAGMKNEAPRADLNRPWRLIRKHADLEGVRIHDLRHSFASVGAGAGLGLPVIGKLLGHTQASTTQRYAHLDADPVRRAADVIASHISEAMNGKEE